MNKEFLKQEFLLLTINGAFARNKVYGENISDDNKKNVRNNIKDSLERLVSVYTKRCSEMEHIKNLDKLKLEIEKGCRRYLKDGQITFGTTQKLLNLFLKYHWSVGWIDEPPHCPIDSIILFIIGGYINDDGKKSLSFTKMTKAQYLEVINKINLKKGNDSIAQWELNNFKRRD